MLIEYLYPRIYSHFADHIYIPLHIQHRPKLQPSIQHGKSEMIPKFRLIYYEHGIKSKQPIKRLPMQTTSLQRIIQNNPNIVFLPPHTLKSTHPSIPLNLLSPPFSIGITKPSNLSLRNLPTSSTTLLRLPPLAIPLLQPRHPSLTNIRIASIKGLEILLVNDSREFGFRALV